ncbi:acid protease [Lactifluus subvellereus]|nr:acid protease [Lactifluus subvellereus]
MVPTALLTASLLLTASVAANHVVVRETPVSLSLARGLNVTDSLDLVRRDRARVKHLVALGQAEQSGTSTPEAIAGINATNIGLDYVASVGVGSPPAHYTLIIDTGSSNTWIGAGKPYVETNTSVKTPDSVATEASCHSRICGPNLTGQSVTYGIGSFSGTDYIDTVTLAPGVAIPRHIGPTDLTIGTLSPDTKSSIPTVTDNLFSQGTIEPGLRSNTTTSPASAFRGIDQSIRHGKSTPILDTTTGLVDTGTTPVYIATDAFLRYCAATGAVLDPTMGLLHITRAQYHNLKPLFFMACDRMFELTANAQIRPRVPNTIIGGRADHIYLVVNDIGTDSGQGFDFVNGYTFLERFNSVYDTGNSRVSLATAPFTKANIN